jgi:outer membrane murein-binding lipoprotein Lpp
MGNIQIESDLKDILNKFDQKLDKLDGKVDKLFYDLTDLKVGQARLEGKIEAVDEKLSGQIKALDTKVEQLDKRVGNQEFSNRGVFIGLVVVILGGIAKLFGFMDNF